MDEIERRLSETITHLSNALEEYDHAKQKSSRDFDEVRDQLQEAKDNIEMFHTEGGEIIWN